MLALFICTETLSNFQNFGVDVLGVDLSTNMINIARQRAVEFAGEKVLLNTVCHPFIMAECVSSLLGL